MRIGFLGPAGTFTEEALRSSAPGGEHEEVPYPTVYETVMAVEEREVDRAVVPIENSVEGSVGATLDALTGEAPDVRIAAEVVRRVHQCLITRPGARLEDIRRVVSHPQATAQCARFLRERLPLAEHARAPSTADAVREVSESREAWAALGSRLAAELYGASVLVEDVQDEDDNITRFVWLAPADAEPMGAAVKTSLAFWGFNDDSPGALVAVLSELSNRGINLTKIESRPRRERFGHYRFFADLEGGAEEEQVREALEALAGRVEVLRVLGSYPAA